MSLSDQLVSLTPINFYQISAECLSLKETSEKTFPNLSLAKANRYLLPDMSSFCSEDSFAKVAIGWHLEGIELLVSINTPFRQVRFPDVHLGDSVEIFIDTRDVKTSGFNTRFCHHFFFLAEAIDGHQAGEITHFRTEDTHPLCVPNDLKVKSQLSVKGQELHLFIPHHCLHGYDPVQFSRLGFSYRINRSGGFSQHFSVVTDDYRIEQQPSLWGSLSLVTS